MRIVITGASGNVGTALLRTLHNDSAEHEIVGISRRTPPPDVPYSAADWISLDIGRADSLPGLTEAFRDADAVVHLAWLIQPSHDRVLQIATNQGGTERVVQAAVDAGVPHLLHTSSVGTYAPAPNGSFVDETWPTTGILHSGYSMDKAAAERLLDRTVVSGLTISRIRPALILQPEAAAEIARYFLGPLVPVSLLRPGLLRFAPLPREITLQFVAADDVARAIVAILQRRAAGAFNLASSPVIDRKSWADLFGGVGPAAPPGLLKVLARLSWRAHLQPTDPGWIDLAAGVPLLNSDRARVELDWEPSIPADTVLLDFLAALRRREATSSPSLRPRSRSTGGTFP